MELENQVCSLELSKRLKELGVKQDSLWWWSVLKGKQGEIIRGRDLRATITKKLKVTLEIYAETAKKEIQFISAFTVAELGEMLPYHIICDKRTIGWRCELDIQNGYAITEDTEANARAKMLVYLLENKLIEVHK